MFKVSACVLMVLLWYRTVEGMHGALEHAENIEWLKSFHKRNMKPEAKAQLKKATCFNKCVWIKLGVMDDQGMFLKFSEDYFDGSVPDRMKAALKSAVVDCATQCHVNFSEDDDYD